MLLLHLGPYKTGTTTLQAALRDAAERLNAFGFYYDPMVSPKLDVLSSEDDSRWAHHQLAFPFLNSARGLLTRDEVYEWFARQGRGPGTTVVSSEALWSVAPEDLCRMIDFAAVPVRSVVVFRCATQMTLSGWHTAVAEGYRSDYATYVTDSVLSGLRRDFDYAHHLTPLSGHSAVVTVDFEGEEPLITRLVRALDLPENVFSDTALLARKHVRPRPWFTSLLLRIHQDPAVSKFGPHERASLSQAVREAAHLIGPADQLEALALSDVTLTDAQHGQMAELCVRNRTAAQAFAADPLTACACGP